MRTRNFIALFVIVFSFIIAGCSSSRGLQSAGAGDVPDWYINVPQDPNYLFAANSQVSQDMQMATDKAVSAGRAEIGRQLEIRIEGLQKRFAEETGTGNDAQLLQMFTQAEKTVVSTTLNGSRVKYQKMTKDGNLWRSYVLIEYPIGAANEALMKQIMNNNEMYTRLRATQTFKELDKAVKDYDASKK